MKDKEVEEFYEQHPTLRKFLDFAFGYSFLGAISIGLAHFLGLPLALLVLLFFSLATTKIDTLLGVSMISGVLLTSFIFFNQIFSPNTDYTAVMAYFTFFTFAIYYMLKLKEGGKNEE